MNFGVLLAGAMELKLVIALLLLGSIAGAVAEEMTSLTRELLFAE